MHLRTAQTQLSVSIQAGSACHRSIEISMQALDRDFVCVLSCDVSAYGGRGEWEILAFVHIRVVWFILRLGCIRECVNGGYFALARSLA